MIHRRFLGAAAVLRPKQSVCRAKNKNEARSILEILTLGKKTSAAL
jgi:hypothetical protein